MAQIRDDEYGDWFPPKAGASEAAQAELKTLLRLVRQGSGTDRLEVRQRMLALGSDMVPGLLLELESGNHLFSESAALVLGELRDPRAVAPLCRVVAELSRGEPVSSALALGRLDDRRAVTPLMVAMISAHVKEARLAAALALGRLGGSEVVQRLSDALPKTRQSSELVALLLALGMTGSPSAASALKSDSASGDDRVRRSALAALAMLHGDEAVSLMAQHVNDEDEVVRIAAISGLAVSGDRDAAIAAASRCLRSQPNERTRAAVALLLAARGGALADAELSNLASDPSERVRAAAIMSPIFYEGSTDERLRQALADRSADVRKAAVIVLAISATRAGRAVNFEALAADRDASVRDAALVAATWSQNIGARAFLAKISAAHREDRMVERATELLRILEGTPDVVRRILRAKLQVLLDDAGLAPGWNTHRNLNALIISALNLDKALPEVGGGVAPGGEERNRPGVIRRVTPELEDLRRHLDRFPYSDRRVAVEVPFGG